MLRVLCLASFLCASSAPDAIFAGLYDEAQAGLKEMQEGAQEGGGTGRISAKGQILNGLGQVRKGLGSLVAAPSVLNLSSVSGEKPFRDYQSVADYLSKCEGKKTKELQGVFAALNDAQKREAEGQENLLRLQNFKNATQQNADSQQELLKGIASARLGKAVGRQYAQSIETVTKAEQDIAAQELLLRSLEHKKNELKTRQSRLNEDLSALQLLQSSEAQQYVNALLRFGAFRPY